MLYSRKQIDKAGRMLLEDPFARKEALEMISKWRETHLPVLSVFREQLIGFFNEHGMAYNFASHRIKRMSSIINKLEHNPQMGLGGLQDIGGIRFVFGNEEALMRARDLMESFYPEGFELRKAKDDYVATPKQSGYRSIHYVYRYHSDSKELDGLSIELQIRTKLQHFWAMAVETASLISKTSLKTNIDDDNEWRGFFVLVSAIFSQKEHLPVVSKYAGFDNKQLCKEYFSMNEEHRFLDQLSALQVTLNRELPDDLRNGYCVLIINFAKRMVSFRTFTKDQEEEASMAFTDAESNIITSEEASLMVSLEKMKEIKEAYPSYFLDSERFIMAIQEFENRCKVDFSETLIPKYKDSRARLD